MRWHPLLLLFATLVLGALGASHALAQEDKKEPVQEGKTLSEWIKQLQDTNAKKRKTAIEAIRKMGPQARAAALTLIQMLKDENGLVRMDIPFVLARIGDSATPNLINALTNPDALIREGAAQALGFMRPPQKAALPVLAEKMKDNVPGVRVEAALAYYLISDEAKTTIPVLIRLYPN